MNSPPYGFVYSIKGKRESMEDATGYTYWHWKSPYGNYVPIEFYGVFDGHGGSIIAPLVAKTLPQYIQYQMNIQQPSPTNQYHIQKVLRFAFLTFQYDLYRKGQFQKEGTTACILLRIYQRFYCANVGDSRAIVLSNQIVPLSKDHKPQDPHEKYQIKQKGGFVSQSDPPRVYTAQGLLGLSLSRALGDTESFQNDAFVVSPHPDITVIDIKKPVLFVIACDGVWDVLTNNQVFQLVYTHSFEPKASCKAIVQFASKKGSTDNITCMTIPVGFGQEISSFPLNV